jgi:O-antigen chain-terminating methyltransferase
MHQSFYRAFEDRYRGSRQLIRSRLEAYAPFVKPFLAAAPHGAERPRALDLGCGRGEWMELLRDWGFDTHGVDLDEGMLAACHDIGLRVTRGDALEYLRALPENSQAIVSAFHVVEHIPFEALEQLAAESLRVLQPGGLLVLETPNPENLIVGTERFHLDPTHAQPIPHLLLSFLLEHRGFQRIKVLPLQEPEGIREKAAPGLQDVVSGVSPDYGAIGQKAAPAEGLAPWDAAFDAAYGQGLLDLANRFDNAQARRSQASTDRHDHASQVLSELSQGLQEANSAHLRRFQELQLQIDQLTQSTRQAEERLGDQLQEAHQQALATARAQYEAEHLQLAGELRHQDMVRSQALEAARTQHEAEHRQLIGELRQQDMSRSQLLLSTQQQLASANERARQLDLQVQALNLHVQALHQSTSWRLTAPVRWLSRRLRARGPVASADESNTHVLPTLTSVHDAVAQPGDVLPATPLTPTGQEVYRALQADRAGRPSR